MLLFFQEIVKCPILRFKIIFVNINPCKQINRLVGWLFWF